MTRIFKTAVPSVLLAAFFLLSCSKQEEPWQNAGGQAAGEEQTFSLSASLPQSDVKTALGAPVSGKYPTLWQTGDCISLNGYSSLPLEAEEAGGRSASFVFRGGLSSPFNILYPATSFRDSVAFPSVQNYTEGSFDPSATPMWASSAKYQDVSLKHLSSLLRFDIKGKVTLKSISITALGEEPLSGPFAMVKDASGAYTGEISPLEAGSPNLTLSFGGSGLVLNEGTATPIYVAIPAGNYSKGFQAIISPVSGKVMVISFFTSGGKNVEASRILHFDEFTFKEGGDTIYICTEEDLAALSSSSATKAFLMKDLDLGSEAWTSITDWNGTFDGTGHCISGEGVTHLFKLTESAESFSLKNLSVQGMPALIISGGDVSVSGCDFSEFGNTTTTEAVVKISAGSGKVVSFDHCRFFDNRNNYNGGVAVQVLLNWAGKLYFNACSFCGNVNKQYGCLHVQAPTSDTGGFVGIFNCLFYDNYGAASSASKATDGTDVNLSIRHLVANSTFVSTREHLGNMNVRCGSMSYSVGAKGGLLVNNIFVNEYLKGYNFSTAAAGKYFLSLGGYNRYDKGENPTYMGVTYSALDNKAETDGNYDSEKMAWTWAPTGGDKDMMFEGSAADFRQYVEKTADATYLKSYAKDFADWLDTLGAFAVDLYGNSRTGGIYWPGCYQGK